METLGEPQSEALLFLNRFRFDPRVGEPDLPSDQRTTYAPGEEGFHLVQLIGPTQDTWLATLRTAGVVVVQFQPTHAYIVRMTPEEAASVSALDFVRAVRVYHAAYRIAPSLLEEEPVPVPAAVIRPAQATLIENVDVTIFDDGHVDETLTKIEAAGGRRVQQFAAEPSGTLVTAIFALPSESIVPVAQFNTVLWLNFSSPRPGLADEMSDQISAGNVTAGVPFVGYNAYLNGLTLSGAGLRLAIVDQGIDYNHPDLNIVAGVSYDGAVPAGDACDGHGTHVAGIAAGNASTGITDAAGFLWGLGMAPGAGLVAQNGICGMWPPVGGWQVFSRDSVLNGAVASNNSWYTLLIAQGYSAATRAHDVMVRDADFTTATAAEPLIMVFAAGNFGPGASTLGEPQEAKNLIVVGNTLNNRPLTADDDPVPGRIGNIEAVLSNRPLFGSSSRGPALDGRVLPNVTAPGTQIASARSDTGLTCTDIPVPGAGAMNYSFCTGTSMASPHVAGAAILITEWWQGFNGGATPSAAMVKALLINGTGDMQDEDDNTGTVDTPIPNNVEGWGRINLTNVVDPPARAIYRDQTTVFDNSGDTWSLRVGPADPSRPLKVSLVWSDAPGTASGGMTGAWVNDLDLRVTQGPTTFLGNVFAGGVSTPGGAADTQNNVENVFIQNPAGVYDVTVNATNVAGDGVPLTGDTTDQDFAFVCSNCNQPPVCDAGGPYVKECEGPTTTVTLDGTASSDPEDDPLTFTWSGPFAGGTATGAMPDVAFTGFGTFSVDLDVSDGMATTECSAPVTITDTMAPVVTCALAAPELFPPNHVLTDVGLSASAVDGCSGALPVGVTVFADEDDETATGDGRFSPDAADIGAETLRLRAERKGDADGRVYLVIVAANDAARNPGHACCTAVVPHSRSNAALASVRAQAAAAEAACVATGAPPAGFVPLGDAPAKGPKR